MSTNSPMPPRPAAALFCSNCGAAVKPGDAYCPKCAAPQPGTYAPPVQPGAYGATAAAVQTRYGGFWIRFVAWLLDAIILSLALMPFRMAILAMMGVSMGMDSLRDNPAGLFMMLPAIGLSWLLMIAGGWLYEALLTSSSKQATIGKMALGLRVTDLQGRRLTFARASGRYFAKFLSSMTLLIGYIIAGFTARKQALHDFVAGTYVVRG